MRFDLACPLIPGQTSRRRLEDLYQLGTVFVSDPVGLGAIEVEGSTRIRSLDFSDRVEGHTDYKPKLSLILKRIHAGGL